jgi:hypothetical protein
LAGEYFGSLGQPIDYRNIFQEFADKRRLFGKPEGSDWRSFSLSPQFQTFDQEWLDRVMKSAGADKPREWKKGGTVHKAGGGIMKKAGQIIGKAAESSGMARPVTAAKDLTTLQDFHTSLGDRIREGVAEANKMMEGFDYKYDKGQRVFTKDSAAKNRNPYEILERTRVGNQIMYDTSGGGMKQIKDPETGRAKRTPYEPGYRVRSQQGEDDSEFIIPASAIIGDVEMARGGVVHKAEGGMTSDDLIVEERPF